MVGESVRLGNVSVDQDCVYWLEGRPSEGGRYVLVRRDPDGAAQDLTPPPYNVRSRVHEYGGAPYLIVDGQVWFCNDRDQRIYAFSVDGLVVTTPEPLTPTGPYRYTDM